MARVYKIRPVEKRLQYSETSVDNSVNSISEEPTITPIIEDVFLEENTVITLETVPEIRIEDSNAYLVENPQYDDTILELLHLPDRWYIKQPEDKTSAPIINFYKEKDIIASLPLTEENLAALMPVLDSLYTRPDENSGLSTIARIKKWMKKHIFSTVLIFLFIALVLYGVSSTAIAAIFVK